MNITKYRPSFSTLVLDSDEHRSQSVLSTLEKAGYAATKSTDAEDFMDIAIDDPPHIIFLEQDTLIILGEDFLEQIKDKLPEVHVIIYARQDDLYSTSQFIEKGVYDCVAYNEENLNFLVLSADRAAERDFFMYMNEQLKAKSVLSAPSPTSSPSPSSKIDSTNTANEHLPLFDTWLSQLHEKRNLKDVIDSFLQEASRHLKNSEVIYFKYVPSHQSLLAAQSIVADINKVRGLGINLIKMESPFSLEKLMMPMLLKSLKSLLSSALNVEKYFAVPLMVQGIPEGIFVFLDVDEKLRLDTYINSCLKAMALKISQINLIKKLHMISIHDDKTRVLNNENFIKSLQSEISRSRRITLPVSLVLVNIDQSNDIEENLSPYEQDMLLKMCATILRRHSRVNDVVGRVDKFSFGILLPHTGKLGGAIKAERLRRIFESADFSKVIPSHKSLTISVGVSEYPSHSRGYEDILQLADEAVSEVKRTGKNKVCLASPPEGFIPDFILDGSKL